MKEIVVTYFKNCILFIKKFRVGHGVEKLLISWLTAHTQYFNDHVSPLIRVDVLKS